MSAHRSSETPAISKSLLVRAGAFPQRVFWFSYVFLSFPLPNFLTSKAVCIFVTVVCFNFLWHIWFQVWSGDTLVFNPCHWYSWLDLKMCWSSFASNTICRFIASLIFRSWMFAYISHTRSHCYVCSWILFYFFKLENLPALCKIRRLKAILCFLHLSEHCYLWHLNCD